MALNSVISEVEMQQSTGPNGDMIVVEDLWRTYDMGSEQQVQACAASTFASSTTSTSPSWARRAPASQR